MLPGMDGLQQELWERLLAVPGMLEGGNSWGDGPALWVDAKQVANFTRDGAIELRLTRKGIRDRRDALMGDPRVTLRGSSDWVTVAFRSEHDFELVVDLARGAVAAHLSADGSPPRPPPEGAAMERRKRWH
jgi:hypothetical protein